MLEFRGVTKRYPGGQVALGGVDLFVDRGEFVFLVGPSGAGKSTLIKLIYREDLPTAGEVIVDGRNVVRLRPWAIPHLRRRIGVVFQDYKLLPGKTAFENVAFALEVTEASPRDIAREVPVALDLVGLADRADAYPDELSGGEQQRVAIARAVVGCPPVLLADEPTGNLDADNAWSVMQLFADIHRRGTTVVVATHARAMVERMGRRVIALERGHIVRDERLGVRDRAV